MIRLGAGHRDSLRRGGRDDGPARAGSALRTDREGIALLIVMLLTMVVAAIAAGAALIGANTFLINAYDQKASLLESVADAGLELGRARLNANPALYSDSSVSTLELGAAVYDASGEVIPGVRRTVYSLPLGGGLGEYGNFAALVAIARDSSGIREIRRLDLIQESFAVYGYFTDSEAGLYFGVDDQLYGPVHSNDDINIAPSGAVFHGPVTTAGSFNGADYGTFLDDTASHVIPILMPTTGQISRLRSRAEPAHLAFTASPGGGQGQSTLRIHFISRDVDGDGVDEGFIRVYRSSDVAWVSGNVRDSLAATPNCGHQHPNGHFYTALEDPLHNAGQVLKDSRRRCYLGGADELNASPDEKNGDFEPTDTIGPGAWDLYPGTTPAVISGEPDAGYLFPIDRRLNPAFRGVIFVDGKVVVSGTVRGRLTLAATGNIIIGDDLVYDTDPGTGTCVDMLGLFSGNQVVVADNTINAPRQPPGTTAYYTYDDTSDEFIHASILALDRFTAQNWSSGSTSAEPCNGATWGRGCLYVTGGIIQQTRGFVRGGGTGYIKRYTHDTCAFTAPPPYFPSTGHFYRGRYYEVNPTGFDITHYFDALN